jgi:hypothetical protein
VPGSDADSRATFRSESSSCSSTART